MQPSRSLLAFAVIADSFMSSGDIVQGLMPLFEPLARDFAGQRFDAGRLAEELKARYDFEIPLAVAEDWAIRLETAGYLENHSTVPGLADYRYKVLTDSPTEPETEAFDSLLEDFKAFVNHNAAGVEFEKEVDLSREFYNRLTRIENLVRLHHDDVPKQAATHDVTTSTLRLRKADEYSEDLGSNYKTAVRLDFLFARFIEELSGRKDGSLDLLARISGGAMLAEVVLSFQEPPTQGADLTKVDFYFDAPLVMDLLGIEPQRERYAKELFNTLKSVNAKLWIFDHGVEEIDRAIHARTSEIHDGRQRMPSTRERVLLAKLKGRVPQELNGLGISIMRFQGDAFERSLAYFSQEQENYLFSAFNFHNNHSEAARSADARSIANIERLRRNRRIALGAPLLSSGPVLVTRNAALASTSRRMMAKIFKEVGGIQSSASVSADVCILDRYLSGLLWITVGGSAKQLPYAQLVANCASAISPKRGVVKKAIGLLSAINQEEALVFEAIMQDERAEHYLVDLTLNDISLVTNENIHEIYEKVRLSVGKETEDRLTAEFQEKFAEQERLHNEVLNSVQVYMEAQNESHKASIEALKKEREADILKTREMLEDLQGQILDSGAAVLQKNIELQKYAEKANSLKAGLRQEKERKHSMLNSCLAIAKRVGKYVPLVVGLVIALAIYLITILVSIVTNLSEVGKSVGQYGSFIIAIGSFFVAFWDTPEILFGNFRRGVVRSCYNQIVRWKGLEDFSSSCSVDWTSLTIASPNDEDGGNDDISEVAATSQIQTIGRVSSPPNG